jgi:hypothetical protein
MNNCMFWRAAVMAAVLACVSGGAVANETVGLAAARPERIGELVAGMEAAAVAPFAGQVIEAIAKMPVSPGRRVRQMATAAEAFLAAAPADRRAALIGQIVGHVPPRLLPSWVETFKPAAAALVAGLDGPAHAAFTADVLKAIDALPLDDEAKTVRAAFAMALLNRAATAEEREPYIKAAVAALPESYRDEVAAAAPAALAGDYTMLLGPETRPFRLVTPGGVPAATNVVVQVGGITIRNTVASPAPDEVPILGVGLERPPVLPPPPVIPPPYKGQF